jgi:hypothetical protein
MKRLLIIFATGLALVVGGLIPTSTAEAQQRFVRDWGRPGMRAVVAPRRPLARVFRPFAARRDRFVNTAPSGVTAQARGAEVR